MKKGWLHESVYPCKCIYSREVAKIRENQRGRKIKIITQPKMRLLFSSFSARKLGTIFGFEKISVKNSFSRLWSFSRENERRGGKILREFSRENGKICTRVELTINFNLQGLLLEIFRTIRVEDRCNILVFFSSKNTY